MKRERNIIELLKELSPDDRATETVRREAQEAFKNYERLSGKEPTDVH
jgi:hypothetical protein